MTTRFLTAASVLALVSACSSQPGPSSISPTKQGHAAWRVGDYTTAEAAYGSALASDPSNFTAMLGLAEVYESTGRTAEAIALYTQVRAARSGAIRVWDDGRPMQDGVTEVAGRRLAALHDMAGFQAPATHHPVYATAQPSVTEYWPEEPEYALDESGVVYYADPAATQPIGETLYETPEAASLRTIMPAPAYQTYQQHSAPAMMAPMQTLAPMPVEETPIEMMVAEPMPIQPMAIETMPIETMPFEQPMMEFAPAPMIEEAAPTFAPAPMTYEQSAIYDPAPVTYQPAPQVYSAPAPMTYMPAPMVKPAEPVYAPAPVVSAPAAAPRGYPGYAVVDGNFVYISAEDIANGATAPTLTGAGAAAEDYGVPIPVSSSAVPLGTPSTFSAPRGVDVMNGLPIPNLN